MSILFSKTPRYEIKNHNMKRFFALAAAAAALCLMTACQKDGVYKPSQRITALYEFSSVEQQRYKSDLKIWETYHTDSVKRHIVERWVWNGKKLERIDLYHDDANPNRASNSLAFVYDGKRLERINISGDNSHLEFEYDGRHLKEMRQYDNKGNVELTYSFEYNGNKINKMTLDGDYITLKKGDPLATFIAERLLACEKLPETLLKNSDTKSQVTATFKWKGDNVSSATYSNGAKYTFRYDTKSNPFRGLLAMMSLNGEAAGASYYFCNENNAVTITFVDEDGDEEKTNYSYTYSDDIPVSRSNVVVDHYAQGYRTVTSHVTTFEYDE